MADIRARLDVAAKLANTDVEFAAGIPLGESAPDDIVDRVTEYFQLDLTENREVLVTRFQESAN